MLSLSQTAEWNFDIDRYVNKVVPPSPLHKLPTPISRWLGYRKEEPGPDIGNVMGAFWSFVGAFCGLAIVAAVFNNADVIQTHQPPALIASFGASAILEYNVIRSPLGQPRNALLGHTFSALIGVSITKLFLLHPSSFPQLRWIAGAISCGLASAVMLLTGTVHPPGGASAVLAATSPDITAMGWYFVGLVMLGTSLMLCVACVINNIQRVFPVYWWTPLDVKRTRRKDEEVKPDAQGGFEFKSEEKQESTGASRENESKGMTISISSSRVSLPTDLPLNTEEAKLLDRLKSRLAQMERVNEGEGEDTESPGASVRSSTECTIVPSHHVAGTNSDGGIP
ncbi:HPP family protein [Periconia macrospinosa]|uniref:HPP family protein n=1 Tax=Periconia macrospinosa TaxID=97972 RepID=A0A2V1DZK1_9PLEO|nr:HPP family protein [Periconia macrospinosa]